MWKRELIKNKFMSLLMILIGVIVLLIEYDITILALTIAVGLPMFFAKENWIV